MSWTLALPIILPFVTAVIAFLTKDGPRGRWWSVAGSLATLIAAAALLREESRGAHYRSDFPDLTPGPGQRSALTLNEALTLRDRIAKDAA